MAKTTIRFPVGRAQDETQAAVDQLRLTNVVGATCTLTNGDKLTYRGGVFQSVEIEVAK